MDNVLEMSQRDVVEKIGEILEDCNEELREAIKDVIDLTDGEYWLAPASSSKEYHLCEVGGLARHSLHVFDILSKLNDSLNAGLDHKEMCVVAFLHDIGKAINTNGVRFYVPQTERWKIEKGILYEPSHGPVILSNNHRSIWAIQTCGLKLTSAELQAILVCSEFGPAEEPRQYLSSKCTLADLLRHAKSLAISTEKRLRSA